MRDFLSQAAKYLKKQKLHKRQLAVFLCLAVIVTFSTVTALKLYGQAMTHQVKVLDCQYQVHTHTDACFGTDEEGNHVFLCGYGDYVVHTHNDDCYDAKGELVCVLEEREVHAHTESCYVTEKVLTCREEAVEDTEDGAREPAEGETPAEGTGESKECADGEVPAEGSSESQEPGSEETPAEGEAPAEGTETPQEPEAGTPQSEQPQELVCSMEVHAHEENCYEDALICYIAEEHVHGEECLNQTLTCGLEEHIHAETCYDEEGNLICGLEEHTAHAVECYTQEYICGKEEHTHNESCHTRNLICGLDEHNHTENCYSQAAEAGDAAPLAENAEMPAPSTESTETPADSAGSMETPAASAGSTETPAASAESTGAPEAENGGELQEDAEKEGHVHTDACYQEVTRLVCGELECHTHTDACYAPECFDEDGNLIEGSVRSCGMAQLEEHVHSEECFKIVELTPEEVAALNQGAKLHIHTEECYDEENNLICGHDATHIHLPECYDDAGKLICGYGTAVHVHEDTCYDEEGSLNCGYETASHPHVESCYDAEGNLQCGYETATHVHEEACYDEDGNVICGYEAASHVHEENCYGKDGNLICGYETLEAPKLNGTFLYETEDYTLEIHVQAEVPLETPEPDATEEPIADPEESETESDSEAEESSTESPAPEESQAENSSEAEVPGTEENNSTEPSAPEESQAESNSEAEESSTEPSEAESQPVADDNAEEPEQEASASGIEELSEVREGDIDTTIPEAEESQNDSKDVPEDTNPDEAAVQPELDTQILLTDEESGLTLKMAPMNAGGGIHAEAADFVKGIGGEEQGSKLLDLSVMELHVYRDGEKIDLSKCIIDVNVMPKAVTTEEMIEAYGEEAAAEEDAGIIVSALEKTADGMQESASVFLTPDMTKVPVLRNAVAENGVLAIARYVNNVPITKTFEGENFIVTAVYKPSASIPAAAELIAEQITEESDSEHYAKRQAEYQEALGDETATMQALMKIGFYVKDENGEFTKEVEPRSPVTITIQFLDENGLAEGNPITVIHFAEEGTELLEGSNVEDGSTTFEMGSFSEIAVGYGVENVKVPVNEELKYETNEFEVTFRIEGEVNVPIVETESEGEAAAPGDTVENNTEESAVVDEAEADGTKSDESVSVTIENNGLDKELEFRVDPLDEGAEEYARATAAVYGEGTDGAEALDDQLFLEVLSYKVTYDGKNLDLSDCVVTAEVTPSQALVEYAETALDPTTLELSESKEIAEDFEVKPEVVLSVMKPVGEDDDTNQMELLEAIVVDKASKARSFSMQPSGKENVMTVSGSSQANPSFIVEFYAEIETLNDAEFTEEDKKTASETLRIIDTAKRENGKLTSLGEGGNLPTNSEAEAGTRIRKVTLDAEMKISMTTKLTEIYSPGVYNYVESPGLVYFNKIAKNDNYSLKEIQVKREGGNGWESYKYEENNEWHFTNKSSTQKDDPDKFILITKDATIRLIYEVKNKTVRGNVNFYDYDISDGNIYKAYTESPLTDKNKPDTIDRGNATTHTSGDVWYMYTNKQGINSMAGQTLGFGNSEGSMLTSLGDISGNRATDVNIAYGKATFGLVTGMANDKIQYKSGVVAPNLFNDGAAAGKENYTGNLIFSQKGDTYTLIGAEVTEKDKNTDEDIVISSVDNLNIFKRQMFSYASPSSPNYKKYYFAANDFYPLDTVKSAGTKGHDLMFGAPEQNKLQNFGGYKNSKGNYTLNAPISDDGQNHNHYFGMQYTIGFDLVKDYVGPLEYIFYGDDDMWIFLDGPETENTGRLICDIGGVHTSIGEYVNLWDYIKKGSEGHYTLTFYYTERGASGSTCWMQFTLPSISFATTDQDIGKLQIQKKVNGLTGEELSDDIKEKEFGFEVKFQDSKGHDLMDDFAYKKFNANGDVMRNDVLIWNNAKFTLKAGEYIIIDFLPDGSQYTIKEVGPVNVTNKDPGEDPEWTEESKNPYIPEISGGSTGEAVGVVTGTITKDSTVEIEYNNIEQFNLPETGGSGTILYTMAGGIVLLFGAGFLYKNKTQRKGAMGG